MINLFNKRKLYDLFKECNLHLKEDINNMSNEKICNVDLEDLKKYYYEKFKLNPIIIKYDFESINYDVEENLVQIPNYFYDNGSYGEEKYNNVDGYKIVYEIPFDGDEGLLLFQPSKQILSNFIVDDITSPTNKEMGLIIISQSYERKIIDEKETLMDFIKKEFESKIKNYINMINYLNEDINMFNSSLIPSIAVLLDERLKKAEDYLKVREKLNIPLELNKNAPNIKPIHLNKTEKRSKSSQFPKSRVEQVEYCISDFDYNNIKNIINLSCISMEKTARTFNKLYEEELRDVILSNLNTHYKGNATGETFNKIGKSDIHIPFENKSAYIGECKIWSGKGLFLDAIEQLFGYMRWRDVKASLIIFNKKNQDFSKILETVEETVSKHELCIKKVRLSKNEWQCDFKKNKESTEIVKINIILYDLYI